MANTQISLLQEDVDMPFRVGPLRYSSGAPFDVVGYTAKATLKKDRYDQGGRTVDGVISGGEVTFPSVRFADLDGVEVHVWLEGPEGKHTLAAGSFTVKVLD